jgi:UDP-GlcNAc:undecaprenyl-phosphate GlcNAc-1-phosphate transferase
MASLIKRIFPLPALLLYPVAVFLCLPQVKAWAESRHVLHAAYLLIVAFIFTYIIMPVVIEAGLRFGIVDAPDEARKQHAGVTPLTGGLAIFIGFCTTILLNFHFSLEMKAILSGGALIFVTGLIDDRYGLSAKVRLAIQLIATAILIYFGVRVTFIPNELGGVFTECIITALWIVGITNSMNFIDGMDGLAGGTGIIYAFFFATVAGLTRQWYMLFLAVAIAGACAGFFPHNFRIKKPARVFLGDSGATFIGFMFASMAILGEWGPSIIDILVPVLIMSVLIFDMTLTTIVRITTGEVRTFDQWIHYTGRDHFHHRLMALGVTEKQAAMIFFAVSICFGIESLTLLFSNLSNSILILVHSIILFILLGFILVRRSAGKPEKAGNACP